jgi:hypothetical protein
MVHRLDYLRDLGQTRDREMKTAFHHVEDPLELRELLDLAVRSGFASKNGTTR